jgi:CRP-like cAMP-binding protein
METDKREQIKSVLRRKIIPILARINGSVPDAFEMAFIANSRIFKGVKDQYIEESGEAEEGHLVYFESGIARCYYYDAIADKYMTTRITRKDDVVIDMNAYLYGTPRTENIQMLETGNLITMPYANLKLLLTQFPEMYPVIVHFQAEREKQLLAYHRLLRYTADERVRLFLDDNPGIATRINNELIASHLDLYRSTFSAAYAKYRAARDQQ